MTGRDTLFVYFFMDALIMVNRMEEVKTVATRFVYVVHHILVLRTRHIVWNRRFFHVPQISKSISERRWQIYT